MASADIAEPSPPNCRTCHKIHLNYDETDFDVRYPDAVTLWINDVTLAIGSGNICSNCHSGIEDFDVNGKKTLIAELTDSLHQMLLAEGLLDEDGYVPASSSSPKMVAPEDAGLIYNFKFVEEDLSEGFHNPGYALALLQNSLEAVAAK